MISDVDKWRGGGSWEWPGRVWLGTCLGWGGPERGQASEWARVEDAFGEAPWHPAPRWSVSRWGKGRQWGGGFGGRRSGWPCGRHKFSAHIPAAIPQQRLSENVLLPTSEVLKAQGEPAILPARKWHPQCACLDAPRQAPPSCWACLCLDKPWVRWQSLPSPSLRGWRTAPPRIGMEES